MFQKGKNNPRWNGGTSEYPNHAELKRKIIEVLKKTKNKCEICGEPAKLVHHINGDKSNHSIDNLIAVCLKCHSPLHYDDRGGEPGRGRPASKYNMVYDITVKEIAKIYGITANAVYYWLKNPEKKKWLEGNLKKINRK